MKYISTRGGISPLFFKEAVMMGLATDGGLILPESLPKVSDSSLSQWQTLDYQGLALEILSLFISDISRGDLKELIGKSYSTFTHPEITPLTKQDDLYILELFHGPTLAFKDVALQFLGNVFEYLLKESGNTMNILGATSGDTGSAAIQGVRGKKNINIFILHPYKRVSPIQELQMTSVLDANVFNIAIKGTFDDGQEIVKGIFNDIDFKTRHNLGAVNSINWARVLAQVVYFIYAYLRICQAEKTALVDFSIPTGNFGDIFAGFVARKLVGADKIGQLVLATNENDILSRFVFKGEYSKSAVVPTASPSMDIQMASNFERYLYYLNDSDPDKTKDAMKTFAAHGKLTFDSERLKRVRGDFSSQRVSEAETIDTIREFYQKTGYIVDPHTAVGVHAAISRRRDNVPMVSLATAHPGKFGDAVSLAIGEQKLPEALACLLGKKTECALLNADLNEVKEFVQKNALSGKG